uniref:Uncharacterized protein n=1 Tax=Anguilla anguilla TaxID=7936 RepID=A0A0E9PHH1_ANGAN
MQQKRALCWRWEGNSLRVILNNVLLKRSTN